MQISPKNISNTKEKIEKDFGISLSELTPTESGQVSSSFFAKIDNSDAVIKYTKSHNSYPKEILIYDALRHLPIDVPEVIGYLEAPTHLKHPCLIISKVPGKSLAEIFGRRELPQTLVKEMGQLLKEIHKTPTHDFGFVEDNLPELRGHSKSLEQFYEKELKLPEKFEYLKEHDYVSEVEFKKLRFAYQNTLNSTPQNTVLTFNDYQQDHIFSDGIHVTGLIDPGNAISCTPGHDIGISLVFLDPNNWDIFLEAYGYTDYNLAFSFSAILCAFKTVNNFGSGKLKLAKQRKQKLREFLSKLSPTAR